MMVILMMVMVMAMFRCWRKKEQPDSCQESTIGTVGVAGLPRSIMFGNMITIVTTITAAFIIMTISSFSVLRFPDHPYHLQPHDLSPRHRFSITSILVVRHPVGCSSLRKIVFIQTKPNQIVDKPIHHANPCTDNIWSCFPTFLQ